MNDLKLKHRKYLNIIYRYRDDPENIDGYEAADIIQELLEENAYYYSLINKELLKKTL